MERHAGETHAAELWGWNDAHACAVHEPALRLFRTCVSAVATRRPQPGRWRTPRPAAPFAQGALHEASRAAIMRGELLWPSECELLARGRL